jgi:hypothetical protein
VCSDPPQKFSHSIWLDPGIMKFVPTPKLNGKRAHLRQKIDGEFQPLQRSVDDCPNVWAFNRLSWLFPDDRFLTADGACWGNHQHGTELTGQPKTVCTMLLALRLLIYLGARRIYLVGVDFCMTPGSGYSFAQARDAEAQRANNAQYLVVNQWLCTMQEAGVFARFGVKVFNCNPASGLRAFPHAPFTAAVQEATGVVEEIPDLAGWYDKTPKPTK